MTPTELKVWRAARNMSQADVAAIASVRREAVNKWEKGTFAIPAGILEKLEAASPSAKAAQVAKEPAEIPYARWRPYPWGRRDYTGAEVDKVPAGTLVWRLLLQVSEPKWEPQQAIAKGRFQYRNAPLISMPQEAFPDPNGIEAPWAREMYASRLVTWQDGRTEVGRILKDMGAPED